MASPYGPPASDVVHKYLTSSHLSRTRALTQPIPTRYHCCCFHSLGGEEEVARDLAVRDRDPPWGRVPRKRRERIFGAIPVAGQVLSRSRRAVRGGAAGPAPQRIVKGSQPTQCITLGLARGSAPSNPRPGRALPWPLHHRRRSLLPLPCRRAFDGVLTPLKPPALPGRLDFLTPWHGRAPRNASWTDSPLRDRRSRRLWGSRNGRLAQRSRGRDPVRANRPDSNCSITPWGPSARKKL